MKGQFNNPQSRRESVDKPKKETKWERIELRRQKIEIEYPGSPIDVYLADKRLQIIDVRNDPGWNADYLLIDPTTFDPRNPTTGYKGIREGESFIIGRNNPWRFEFPNTVSRKHLEIGLRGGKLIIEDLGSTNGTTVEFEKLKEVSKKEKERDIAEFRDFLRKYQEEIEKAAQEEVAQQGKLADFFYYNFYNTNIDQPKYKKNDPEVQKLVKEYPDQINKVYEILYQEAVKRRGIVPIIKDYWFACHIYGGTKGGTPEKVPIGRFYLNLKPKYIVEFFEKAAIAFRNARVHVEMKIPSRGDVEEFNRLDKMVIYFRADEEKDVLKVLEDLYHNNQEAFDTGIPRFTAEVKDSMGKTMVGIGFGEEPLEKKSFGDIRSEILADEYKEYKEYIKNNRNLNFDFEASFNKLCLSYGVDPDNPAFNLGGDPNRFAELRKRIRAK